MTAASAPLRWPLLVPRGRRELSCLETNTFANEHGIFNPNSHPVARGMLSYRVNCYIATKTTEKVAEQPYHAMPDLANHVGLGGD